MKRLIISYYYVDEDFEGIFKCDKCGQEAPWQNENYEARRCDDPKCNGRVHLQLFRKIKKEVKKAKLAEKASINLRKAACAKAMAAKGGK